MDPSVVEKYSVGLNKYLHDPGEENLYQAFLLSSDLVEKGVGPDEMVEIHSEALAQISQGHSSLKFMNYTMQSFTFLLEVMITYGLIHKRYLDNRDAQINQLKAYVGEIEKLNNNLDQKVNEAEMIALIANTLTLENDDMRQALKDISAILENTFPGAVLFFVDKSREDEEILVFKNRSEEALSPGLMDKIQDLMNQDDQNVVIKEDDQKVLVGLPIQDNGIDVILGLHYSSVSSCPAPNFWLTIKDLVQSFLEKMSLIGQLRIQSIQDSMTGLYNHRFFVDSLNKMVKMEKRSGGCFSLMLIDVDNFKDINDEFGHVAGDDILKKIAETLKKCVRDTDTLCRYGGDEFVIILPDTSSKQALQLGERISRAIKSSHWHGPELTVSTGIAQYTGEDCPMEFVRRTDQALYQAKKQGKDLIINVPVG